MNWLGDWLGVLVIVTAVVVVPMGSLGMALWFGGRVRNPERTFIAPVLDVKQEEFAKTVYVDLQNDLYRLDLSDLGRVEAKGEWEWK